MYDKDFLQWLYNRLHHEHGENKNVDYMRKLKSIIEATDPDQLTPNTK
jgi:hypothetical protein